MLKHWTLFPRITYIAQSVLTTSVLHSPRAKEKETHAKILEEAKIELINKIRNVIDCQV